MVYDFQITSAKIKYIAVIVPLVALVLALAGGFGVLWRFFVFFLMLLILSYLWVRLNIRNISGTVEKVVGYYRVGEMLEERFTVSNNGGFPTSVLEIYEETDLPGYQNAVTTILSPHSTYRWRTVAKCQRRGRYTLGPLMVRVTDPLGLFSISRQASAAQRIIVYPEVHELPFFQTVPRLEPGASRRRWLAGEISPNASRVREYISGDSLQHIHWHSTAHTGVLMVKEFDPDRSNISCKDVWIFPDMHRSCGIGDRTDSIEEYIIVTAASLTKKYIDAGKEVGLVTSGDRSHLFLPRTGEQHLRKILNTLAEIRATGGINIDYLLTAEMGRISIGSVIIVITSSDNWAITPVLRRAVSRGAIVMVILIDSLSFGGRNSAAGMARTLISNGITVYVIRRGMDLARALDSRTYAAHPQ